MRRPLNRAVVVPMLLILNACGESTPQSQENGPVPRTDGAQVDFNRAPAFVYPAEVQVFTRGAELTPLRPSMEGGAAQNCSSTPPLPNGLRFEEFTCGIVGKPLVTAPELLYTVVAQNPAGQSQSQVRLKVVAPPELQITAEDPSIEPSSSSVLHASGGFGRYNFKQVSGQGRIQVLNDDAIEYFAGESGGAATIALADEAGQVAEFTIEVIPPAISAQDQNFQVDASRATGTHYPGNGCRHRGWTDLSAVQAGAGTLVNFSGSCGLAKGWNGSGSPADPHRLTFEGRNNQRAAFNDRDEHRPNQLTVEAWFRVPGWSGYRPIVMKSSEDTWADGYGLYVDPNGSLIFFTNGYDKKESSVSADIRPLADHWVHAVGVFDGTLLSLYINGDLAATLPHSVSINHSRSPLNIGGMPGYTFRGDVAAASIYGRAFDHGDVRLNCLTRRDRFEGARCGNMVVNPSSRTALVGRTYETEARNGVGPYSAKVERGEAEVYRINRSTFRAVAPMTEQEVVVRITDARGYSRTQTMRVVNSVNATTDAAVAFLDANRATGTTFPGTGCTSDKWADLSALGLHGVLKGFDHCSPITGWNGGGITGEPHRLTFDGRDDHVVLSSNPAYNTPQMSFEVWFRGHSSTGIRPLLVRTTREDWQDGMGLYLEQNKLSFYINRRGRPESDVKANLDVVGTYTHVVGTYDGQRIRLYVNGRLAKSRAYTQPIQHKNAPILLGAAPGVLNFSGQVVKTAVYSRALGSEEIRNNCLAVQDRFLPSVMCW
jgi:hypothetical protein